LPFTTSGQETEWVYSIHTGQSASIESHAIIMGKQLQHLQIYLRPAEKNAIRCHDSLKQERNQQSKIQDFCRRLGKQSKAQNSQSDLLISSVVALYQDGCLNLLELLTSLLFLLVLVATIKTLNDLCCFIQPSLLLVCTPQ